MTRNKFVKFAARLVLFFVPPLRKRELLGTINFYRFRHLWNPDNVIPFKGVHAGATIYVLGGGHSLNETNLSTLNGQVVVFCNMSFKLKPQFRPKFSYSVLSGRRMNDLRSLDRGLFDASFRAFGALGTYLGPGSLSREDIVLRVPTRRGLLRVLDDSSNIFSTNLAQNVAQSGGGSVIFTAIQIASYMGATKIVLLGVDLGSQQGKQSHFDQLQDRNYDMVTRRPRAENMLREYRNILSKKGVELLNASPSTFDRVLPKISLED